MADKVDNKTLETLLEEAKRQGRKEGMADLFGALSLADGREQQGYFVAGGQQVDGKTIFQNRVDEAMMNAATQNQAELVIFLLKAGADVNTLNGGFQTALHIAAREGHTEVVQALLKAGADPNLKNYDGGTPLACAVNKGHIEIVKALLKAGADVHSADKSRQGYWLVDYAAEGDHVEMTQLVLEAGAYLGPDVNRSYRTPLMYAAFYGNTESAALLIEAGSDINAKDVFGKSVLMVAAMGGKQDIVNVIRLLRKSGAEINGKDNVGYTALMCAAEAGRSDAVRLLLSAGADVFIQGKASLTITPDPRKRPANAFDVAADDAVKEIIKSEMHRRIVAALSVLSSMPVDVRQKTIQLYLEN